MTTPLGRDCDRIVILCPTWVGDTVMSTPVLRAVRRHLPEAHVIVAGRTGLLDLLRGAPWYDDLLEIDARGTLGPWRAASVLRQRRPDAVLLLPNSFRSGLVARLSGARRRIGYRRDGRRLLLTHRLDVERSDHPTPTIDYYARLGAFALGVESIDTHPELFTTDEEYEAAERVLEGVVRPFVLIAPGASKPAKRWPAERFAAVADALHERRGLAIAVSGAPNERAVLDAVRSATRTPITDLTSRGLTLGSLKAVIRQAALMMTNDTGPRHIAAALGTPLVTLFGPTDHRWTTLPHARERSLLAEPFLPETLIADRHPKLCAIGRIHVEDVLAAAGSLLDDPPV
jgi:heptosyltransferase-2